MLWNIHHVTEYAYTGPVFLEPHVLRLTPCSDATQQLQSFEMQITPEPAGRSEVVGMDGNRVTHAWFEEQTESLRIEVRSRVATLRDDPFGFLWEGARTLPLRYGETLRNRLWPYSDDRALAEVGRLADESALEAGGDAQTFPMVLASKIHARCEQVYREEGHARPGAKTLRLGEGSCRDLAQLFLEAARGKGYAGRFVSGYVGDSKEDSRELHAWAELFLPGGGWRGFDATSGLAVGAHHIALARGVVGEDAAPLSGTIRGSAVSSLKASVRIEQAG